MPGGDSRGDRRLRRIEGSDYRKSFVVYISSGFGSPVTRAVSFMKVAMREVYLKDYRTFEDTATNLEPFIEDVDNTKRLHSRLGYRPSIEVEAAAMTGKG